MTKLRTAQIESMCRQQTTNISRMGFSLKNASTLCWEAENAGDQRYLSPFPTMFSNDLFLRNVKAWLFAQRINHAVQFSYLTHSHSMTPFDAPLETSLLKTLWEKEKLLIKSNFSFSHSVFYLFG